MAQGSPISLSQSSGSSLLPEFVPETISLPIVRLGDVSHLTCQQRQRLQRMHCYRRRLTIREVCSFLSRVERGHYRERLRHLVQEGIIGWDRKGRVCWNKEAVVPNSHIVDWVVQAVRSGGSFSDPDALFFSQLMNNDTWEEEQEEEATDKESTGIPSPSLLRS